MNINVAFSYLSKQNCFYYYYFLKWINRIDSPNSWPKLYLGSTPELSFKTIIITIFIHTLTRVNSCWPSWLVTWALPRSTPVSGFKIMIITTFILTLIQVDPLGPWLKPYPRLTPESSFKTMIIITFMLC